MLGWPDPEDDEDNDPTPWDANDFYGDDGDFIDQMRKDAEYDR